MSHQDDTGDIPLSARCWTASYGYNIEKFRISDRREDLGLIIAKFGDTDVALPESEWMKVITAMLRLRWETATGLDTNCDGCADTKVPA